MGRECGPCAECCTALAVHELGKREFSRCRHEKASKKGACSIYGTRPESCREFKCLWLADPQHLLDRKDRPDRTGIVFASADMSDRQVVVAFVRKPGADASGRGKELIDKLAVMIPVCILRWDGTRSVALPQEQAGLIDQIRADFNAQAVVDDDGKLRRLPIAPV